MNRTHFLFFIILTFVLSFSFTIAQNSFIGAESCGTCHKSEKQGKQLDIWQKSSHSQAYKTLLTEEAVKIASNLGLTTPPSKSEACLKCHTSGYNADAKLLGAKFKIEDGVQCESCHGAGSNYKNPKVMKDRKAAVENGLIVPGNPQEFCSQCHNSESPTFKEFNFAAQWEKIKHSIPKN